MVPPAARWSTEPRTGGSAAVPLRREPPSSDYPAHRSGASIAFPAMPIAATIDRALLRVDGTLFSPGHCHHIRRENTMFIGRGAPILPSHARACMGRGSDRARSQRWLVDRSERGTYVEVRQTFFRVATIASAASCKKRRTRNELGPAIKAKSYRDQPPR